jgi:hypothetical protein
MKLIYFAEIKDGKLKITNRRGFDADLLEYEGKRVQITIERNNKRTSPQNRYLHALFTIFTKSLNELGNNFKTEEVKELVKFKFLTLEVVNESTGETIGQRIKGTHELNKEEMGDFIDRFMEWSATDFNIILPISDEQQKFEY